MPTVTAVVPSQVVEVPGAAIEKLLNNPAAALAMVRTVTGRLRSTELALRQSQHMKLLGETTALLLHNLNNPAAAARRAAAYLDQAVPRWREAVAPLEPDEVTHLEQGLVRPAGGGVGAVAQRAANPDVAGERGFPPPSALSELARRWWDHTGRPGCGGGDRARRQAPSRGRCAWPPTSRSRAHLRVGVDR